MCALRIAARVPRAMPCGSPRGLTATSDAFGAEMKVMCLIVMFMMNAYMRVHVSHVDRGGRGTNHGDARDGGLYVARALGVS